MELIFSNEDIYDIPPFKVGERIRHEGRILTIDSVFKYLDKDNNGLRSAFCHDFFKTIGCDFWVIHTISGWALPSDTCEMVPPELEGLYNY